MGLDSLILKQEKVQNDFCHFRKSSPQPDSLPCMMGDLLEYFEEKSRNLDNMAPNNSVCWNSGFVSCIRFQGVPILPPVLTQRRRTEMLTYKRQAIRRDYKRRIKKREELDSGVKSIIANVEKEFSLKSRSTLPRTAGLSKFLEKRASRWSDSSPSSPKSTSSDTSRNKFFGQDHQSSVTEESSESDLSSLAKADQSQTGTKDKPLLSPEAGTVSNKSAIKNEKPEKKKKEVKKQDLRDRTNSLERQRRRKTDPSGSKSSFDSPNRSRTNSESNNSGQASQTLTNLRRSSSLSSLPNPAKIFGVNSQIPKPPTTQMSQQHLARRALRQYSNSNPDLRNVDDKGIKASGSSEDITNMNSLGLNGSLRQSMSNPDLSNTGEDRLFHKTIQNSSSQRDIESVMNYLDKSQLETDKLKKKQKTNDTSKKSDKKNENKQTEKVVQDRAKPKSVFGNPGDKLLPNNTQSDFPSLENCNSLPEDIDGLPLTSVREQQISHTLAKLSRVLNMEDTMSTLTSTSSSEMQNTILRTQIHVPVVEEEEQPSLVLSHKNQSDSHQGTSSQTDTNILMVHIGSAPKTSESVVSGQDSGPDSGEHSSVDNSRLNPVSASFRSSASSVTGSQAGRRLSPKGLKNTVHFAPLVTEISTSASQSVEDKILMRKLDITPSNSLQVNSLDIDESDGGVVGSIPASPKSDGSKPMRKIPKHKNDLGLVPPLVDITKVNSMLSKVALSPDTDSTGGTPVERGVPFGLYGYPTDPENNTSDKENEFRKKQGRNENNFFETENNTTVSNILNAKNIPPPHHKLSVPSSQYVKSSITSRQSDDSSQASTLKASQEVLQSVGSNANENVYGTRMSGTQGHPQHVKRKLPSVTAAVKLKSHEGVQVRGDVTNISAKNTPVGFEHEMYSNPAGHEEQNKKIAPASQKTFPILTHATAHNHRANNTQTGRYLSTQKEDSEAHRRLNMDPSNKMNYTAPQNIPSEIDAEQEAKAEHIRRYLSHVQRQSLEDQSPNETTKPAQGSHPEESMFDIGSTIQSFTSTLQSLSNVDEEELLRIQAEHFEKLRKHLVEQQKQQLEELFVHQRREQLTLQEEIEMYQDQLKDQQEFLAENSPQTTGLQQHQQNFRSQHQNPGLQQHQQNFRTQHQNPGLQQHQQNFRTQHQNPGLQQHQQNFRTQHQNPGLHQQNFQSQHQNPGLHQQNFQSQLENPGLQQLQQNFQYQHQNPDLHLQQNFQYQPQKSGLQHQQNFQSHHQNPASRNFSSTTNNLTLMSAMPNQPHMPPNQMSDERSPQDANTSRQYSYISSPSLYFNPRERDNGSDISTFSKATPKQSLKFANNSAHSTPKPSQHKPVQRSPVKQAFVTNTNQRISIPERAFDPNMKRCFDRVSACVKGYLTRRLLKTEKVQAIIKTINDTKDFAISFQQETPIRHGNVSHQDRHLLDRIIAQLQGALLDIHEIFFEIPVWERMDIISHSRQLWEEKRLRESAGTRSSLSSSQPRISAATLKAMERKKKALEETSTEFRPRSAPPNTVSNEHQMISHRSQRNVHGQSGISTRPKEQTRPKTAPSQSGTSLAPGTKAKKTVPNTANSATSTKTTTSKSGTAVSNNTSGNQTAGKSKIGIKAKTKNNSKAWKG